MYFLSIAFVKNRESDHGQECTGKMRMISWNEAGAGRSHTEWHAKHCVPSRPAPSCPLWLCAGHNASGSLQSLHGILIPFLTQFAAFKKMVTFIDYEYLYHNSDLLTGSWKKIFSLRTSCPQNCLSMPLLRVVWMVFVPKPPSRPSSETWGE